MGPGGLVYTSLRATHKKHKPLQGLGLEFKLGRGLDLDMLSSLTSKPYEPMFLALRRVALQGLCSKASATQAFWRHAEVAKGMLDAWQQH